MTETGKELFRQYCYVYDNIAALREQAIAQAYQAKMQATANSYVEQELEGKE